MNIEERIRRLFKSISSIGKGIPTTIILNSKAFADWYYYCEENNLDYEKWEGKRVILDKGQPFMVTVSYHDEEI